MLTSEQILETARRLEHAAQTRTPMTQLSVQFPDMTIDDAYAVQTAWRQLQISRGRKLAGRKIGLTSRTMQKAQEVDEPDRGSYICPLRPFCFREALSFHLYQRFHDFEPKNGNDLLIQWN